MSYCKRLTEEDAIKFGFEVKKSDGNINPKYYFSDQIIEEYNLPKEPNRRKFVEVLRKLDKNGEILTSVEKLEHKAIEVPDNFEVIKITNTPYTSGQFIQYAPKKIETEIKEIDFESIIKKYIKPYNFKPAPKQTGAFLFDRLVYTDVHIGMTTNQNGYSLYGGKWDEQEIKERLDIMVKHVLENKKSNTLIVDDLGDFMDGYDAETVRKGHKLPQNMDNEKAFDVGLSFKIKLADALAPYYSKIVFNDICDDNHSGSFGYVVNSAFKKFIEYRYKHILVNNIRKFMHHYLFGNNCFIITHGKDGKNLKFGFKPILDAKQIEKINNYIEEHKLFNYNIEFSKGDSHQKIFDETTSDLFNYYSYPAFSPSSEWVQTNFKKGMSGFEFFNFKEDGNKTHIPYKFVWKKNREDNIVDFSV